MKYLVWVLMAGCADDTDPCADTTVPSPHVDQRFDQASLTCYDTHYYPACNDPEMCICDPTSMTVAQCTGECFYDDEQQCTSDSICFATRDADSLAFIACYPNQEDRSGTLAPCAERSNALDCEAFSETSRACEPLYRQGQFVSCADRL